MHERSCFKIQSIRLANPSSCELYMENIEDATVKGWLINNKSGLSQRFYEHMNTLCSAENPFQRLLELKQFYQVEVLR